MTHPNKDSEGGTMTHFDYHKFVHPVPVGYTIPASTQVRSVSSDPHVETFFITPYDYPIYPSNRGKYYLTFDITKPEPPEEINSVIYNVQTFEAAYPVAVYQGSQLWSAFSNLGGRSNIYTLEIESFDTTPAKKEARGNDD